MALRLNLIAFLIAVLLAAPAWTAGLNNCQHSGDCACSDLTGSAASCSTDTTNASNISSGSLAVPRTVGTPLTLANEAATGTTLDTLECITAANTAIICPAGTATGIQGVTVVGAGKTGSSSAQTSGVVPCVFSGGITAGHFAQIDASVAGECVDGGATFPTTGGEVIGTIVSATNGGAGTYNVDFYGPDVAVLIGGGGGGGGGGGNGNLKNAVFGVGFDFMGTPTASAIEAFNCPATYNFPSGLTTPTSSASCGTNPGETDDYIIKVAGTQKADISLSTSCVATLTASVAFTCTAGQRLEIDAPATVSGTDVTFTLAYKR